MDDKDKKDVAKMISHMTERFENRVLTELKNEYIMLKYICRSQWVGTIYVSGGIDPQDTGFSASGELKDNVGYSQAINVRVYFREPVDTKLSKMFGDYIVGDNKELPDIKMVKNLVKKVELEIVRIGICVFEHIELNQMIIQWLSKHSNQMVSMDPMLYMYKKECEERDKQNETTE